MSEKVGIFISYRRIDANWAGIMLENFLARQFPDTEVFFDLRTLRPGETWPDGITDNLGRARLLLAVIGPTWLTLRDEHDRRRIDDEDDWVRREIDTAFQREIPVIPVLLDGARLPGERDPRELPKCLQPLPKRGSMRLRMTDYATDLDRLAGRVSELLPGAVRANEVSPGLLSPPKPDGSTLLTPERAAALIAKAAPDDNTLRSIALEEQGSNPALAEALTRIVVERSRQEPPENAERLNLVDRGLLAAAAYEQGRYEEARRLYGELLAGPASELGAEDPTVLAWRHNRASALLAQGRAAEAEAEFRELLTLKEKVQGPEHPNTLATRHEIASALVVQGRPAEAESELRELLTLKEKVQGPEHPSTLATRHQIASALLDQGRPADAETEFRELLTLCGKVQGPEHPSTIPTRHQIASALLAQGRPADAETEFRELLTLCEKSQGPEHPSTLATRHSLAVAKLAQGRVAEAETDLGDLLRTRERTQGADHSYTLTTRRALARAALEQGAAGRARAALAPLPADGGDPDPLRRGQTAVLRGWLADLDGDAARAEALLDAAEAHLAHLAPEHYARRELAKYCETRVPGGAGGTMLWARDIRAPD